MIHNVVYGGVFAAEQWVQWAFGVRGALSVGMGQHPPSVMVNRFTNVAVVVKPPLALLSLSRKNSAASPVASGLR